MALFGKKKEEEASAPNFVKIAYDAQHRPIDVKGFDEAPPLSENVSSLDKEWFKKWFDYINKNIESLKLEISRATTKETPQELVGFLSKWKQDFNNNLDAAMLKIQSVSRDPEIVREMRHVDEGLKSLRNEIRSDIVPKDDIIGRLVDIQSKVNAMNQLTYQKMVGKYELADEVVKSLQNVLQTGKKLEREEPKVKVNRAFVERIVIDYLGIKDSEKVVVLTDKKMMKLGRVLHEYARTINKNTLLVVMERKNRDGEEPDESVARLIKEFDAVIIVTYYSIVQTRAVKEALEIGARVISLSKIPITSFIDGGLTADPKQVKTITDKMFDYLKNSKEIHVVSSNGTDVKFSVIDRRWFKNDGFVRGMGDFAIMPPGSVMIAPVESTVDGKIVFDRKPNINIELTVEGGLIKKLKGDIGKTKEIFSKFGPKAVTISEFGIGCNPKAKIIGNVSEDKKVFGVVYFGIGNNLILGGDVDVPSYKDGVVEKASVYADGFCVIKEGKFLE
jgi:leucyl aminopeptidase (aminopeptidase T)